MDENKPSLGIYGIQDRVNNEYPEYVHDHNIALMEEGAIRYYLHLERLTRNKRDHHLHKHLSKIIKKEKWVDSEYDVVFVDNVVGRAFISTNGKIRFEAPLAGRLSKDMEKGKLWWFNREPDAYILNHELAHIFSSLPFYGPFEENSLLVHFDGGASLSNFSAWIYRQGKIIPVEHHWELKYLTSLFNANALTFGIIGANLKEQNSVPGKLMGYAALGTYNEDIEFWLRQNHWFENIWGRRSHFFEKAKSDFGIDLKSFDQRNSFLQDIVATIQEVFMRDTLLKLDDLNSLSNCKNLYYTGGCALNIHTNSAIVESRLFEQVFIPPCPDDSGLALGAAAYLEWKKGHTIKKHGAFINNWDLEIDQEENYNKEFIGRIANLIALGKVIGVHLGFGESGPRALGNRSLIALPTKALAYKVSVIHKKREWYRPVAPVMLQRNVEYFTGQQTIHHLSRYMLLDMPVLPERQHEIAGVVHSNGTARIQTLFGRDDHWFLWDVLQTLDEQYNVKALINTSFNSQGEPIVHSRQDALNSARAMGIDAVVTGGQLILLNE